MKKISLLILLLISNLSIISCTEESLTEISEPDEEYASEGEEDPNDPSDDPPGDGN